MKIVTSDQMRSIEQAYVDRGIPLEHLMQHAGAALAAKAEQMAEDGSILMLVGPGNNGGDGLVAAAELASRDRDVSVYDFNRADVAPFGGTVIHAENDSDGAQLRRLAADCSLIVDSLLGIGQSRPVEGALAAIVTIANTNRGSMTRALATDIPTG